MIRWQVEQNLFKQLPQSILAIYDEFIKCSPSISLQTRRPVPIIVNTPQAASLLSSARQAIYFMDETILVVPPSVRKSLSAFEAEAFV